MVTLLQHLGRNRFEPHIAVASARGALLSELPPDVVLHDLKASRVRFCLPALLRLIWRLRPKAILSTSGHVNVPLLAMRPLLPRDTNLFVRENSTASVEAAASGDVRRRKLLYRCFYHNADAVICQSEVMLDDLCGQFHVPRKKMIRIYNPVDGERIRSAALNEANPFYGLGPHLVASGRLEHAKGFDLLIEAMLEVRKQFPNVQLAIVGAGSLEKELRSQCARLGLSETITFAGFHSNPYPFYANANLFVLSSRYEGLPNVMLEAMALNTPVVATDCPGGVREIVKGWPNCRLAGVGNSAALVDAIVASLRDGPQHTEALPSCCFNETALPFAMNAYETLLLGQVH
jgi:glycosyltransferase involved in cell wall biosynthesis